MNTHTNPISIVRSFYPCGITIDDLISIYALSAHGKVVNFFNVYLWAERLWKSQ